MSGLFPSSSNRWLSGNSTATKLSEIIYKVVSFVHDFLSNWNEKSEIPSISLDTSINPKTNPSISLIAFQFEIFNFPFQQFESQVYETGSELKTKTFFERDPK